MKPWIAYLLVGALLLGGLALSACYSPVWYDDAGHYLVAREVARGHGMCYPLQSDAADCVPGSPFITMGPVQAYPLGAWLAVFGESMAAARALMVLLSICAAVALWALARRLNDAPKALVAVAVMAVNVQFMTYGAQALAEVPMMGLFLAGLWALVRWQQSGRPAWAGAGLVLWMLAVGVKEYALLPMGLALLGWWLMGLGDKAARWSRLGLGLAAIAAMAATLLLLHGGWGGLLASLDARKSYGSEFLAFNWAISLKFLLFKPLFWLGTGAMVLRWRVQRRPQDGLMVAAQAAWLAFYLLSAGYDRFGFLLLFLPAIYLAEFAPYLWREAARRGRRAWLKRAALLALAAILFGQQAYLRLGARMAAPGLRNSVERTLARRLQPLQPRRVLTADQHMVLFLEEVGLQWRLVRIVPSQGAGTAAPHADFDLRPGEVFLAGPYAFTEYAGAIDWASLQPIDSLESGGERWGWYEGKE